jgi:hypothetical protein
MVTIPQHRLATIDARIGDRNLLAPLGAVGSFTTDAALPYSGVVPVRFPLVSTLVLSQLAFTPAAEAAPRQSLIPPVVLQGCSEKVNGAHSSWLVGGVMARAAGGNAQGEQTVGFDLSFVNTSDRVATLVRTRVGRTDSGTFTPNAVIAWRIAAKSGKNHVSPVIPRF